MKPLALVLAVGLVSSAQLAVDAKDKDKEKTSDTSESLSYATYKQRVGRVEVVVGSEFASLSKNEKLLPLQIAVGVWGPGPELQIAAERFLLIDTQENLLNALPLETFTNKAYSGILEEAKDYVSENPLKTGDEFSLSRRVASNFYPLDAGNYYEVSNLDRETYLEDVVFFPRPEGGIDGVLTLQLLTTGMTEPVEVRFKVPQDRKVEHPE